MHAERDYLRQIVFPALEEKLRERSIRLEPVDLRWGVETVSVAEQEAKELLVLKVCLGEIERSRPYLIALLGDRYGWVPPRDRIATAAIEAGFQGDLAGKSVTALEIEFGVLNREDQLGRSFFYFRDPLPYDEMTPDLAASYRDGAEALTELKRELIARYPDRVRSYHATWNARDQRVSGLEEFGTLVLGDLSKALEAESEAPVRTWQERERWLLSEFVDRTAADFQGREALLEELVRFAGNDVWADDLNARCVIGPPGTGKSALMSGLCRRLGSSSLVLAHAAGISPDSTSVDRMLRRWTLELAGFLGIADPTPGLESLESLIESFRSLLTQASRRQRVVCLLDAMNQLERTTAGIHQTWLPRPWPEEARLIATAVEGPESAALVARGAAPIRLPSLDHAESERIIASLCRRHRKALHSDITRALLAKRRPDGSLASGNPLWLTLALDELFLLDADDFDRADRSFAGAPEERLHALLLDTVEQLPADVAALYGYLLERNEKIHGERWARAFASLIATSRAGLRERDLEHLMPDETGEPWDGLHVAALRRSFRAHLAQRGALAQWDFGHSQMREAVLRRYLRDPVEQRRLHARIADHLESLPATDGLRQTDLMIHYIGADDPARAAMHLGGELSVPELAGATAALVGDVPWASALPLLPALPNPAARRLCERFRESLAPAARNALGLDAMRQVLQASHRKLAAMFEQDPRDSLTRFELARTLHLLGHSFASAGDIDTAIERYRVARQIMDELAVGNPQGPILAHERAKVAASQAGALLTRGKAQEALEPASLAYFEMMKLNGSGPQSFPIRRDTAIAHSSFGDVLRAVGDPPGAFEQYQASERLLEGMLGDSANRREVINHLTIVRNKIATAWAQAGQPARAIEIHRKVLEQRKQMAQSAPDDREAQVSLGIAWNQLGADLLMMGDGDGALRAHEAALANRQAMVELDPGNGDWQQLLAASHRNIADVKVTLGQVATAMTADLEAIRIRRDLVERYPGNAAYRRSLAGTLSHIASVYVMMGMVSQAVESLSTAEQLQVELLAIDAGNSPLRQELDQTRQLLRMLSPNH